MARDEVIRLRCTAAEKERLKLAAEQAGESLSGFILFAAKLFASEHEHGSVTRANPKLPIKNGPQLPPKQPDSVQLSGGLTIGKRSFTPDPKK